VTIKVNGKEVKWIKDETVKELLNRIKYTFPLVVVKINDKVIPRSDFSKVKIPDDSKISVIHMISGG
jgi:thiazole synthase/sulfur carrier protein